MSISNSIRKVLKEQSEKTKSVLVEKEIIENKINYIFNSTNKINKKSVVIKESNNLLNMGYDKKLIKEVAKKYLN
jgi:5-methylthioribose kinase